MKTVKLYSKIGLIACCVIFTSALANAQEDDAQESEQDTIEELTAKYQGALFCSNAPVVKGGRICRDATLYQQYAIAVEYYYDGLSDNKIKIKRVRKYGNDQDAEKEEKILEFPVTEERRCIIELADDTKLLLTLDEHNQLKVKVYD